MVSPPPDVGRGAAAAAGVAAAPPARAGTPGTPGAPVTPGTEQGTAAPGSPLAALDTADIRPLDVAAALQILVAEVRASLLESLAADLDTSSAGGPAAATGAAAAIDFDGVLPAARVIVDQVLQSLPDTFEPSSWSVALPRADSALQAGVQRALDVVAGWRDVPLVVVEATKEAGGVAVSLIADEQPYPVWPPPEWLSMAPRLALFWRRRRALKRRLLDPDHEKHGQPDIPDPGGEQWDGLDDLGS